MVLIFSILYLNFNNQVPAARQVYDLPVTDAYTAI